MHHMPPWSKVGLALDRRLCYARTRGSPKGGHRAHSATLTPKPRSAGRHACSTPATAEPATVESATVEPATIEPATVEPAARLHL